jgi:hypothetical protein
VAQRRPELVIESLPGSLEPTVEITPASRYFEARSAVADAGLVEERAKPVLTGLAALIGVEGDDQMFTREPFEEPVDKCSSGRAAPSTPTAR